AVVACAPADDGTGDLGSDEFASSLPSEEMLSMSSASSDTVEQGLSTAEQGLTGDPSQVRERAEALREGLNALRAETHERIRQLVESGEQSDIELQRLACRKWEADGPNNHWKLTACKVDARAERFAWTLEGKPLESGDEAYLVVFAGKGAKL